MSDYPEIARTKNKDYRINTDYKIAIGCDQIARSNISDEERSVAIIYLLFGDKGIENPEDWEELLKIAIKYLSYGRNLDEEVEEKEANMSFEQDLRYIKTSFFSDYKVDIDKINMHWYEFFDLLCGLTDKCVLNRIRFIRDFDESQIKDSKEREKWIEQKKLVALKKEKTSEEKRLDELFEKQIK